MNTPVPSRSGVSASPVTVAIVGIAGAVAGSLAVWTALAPGAEASAMEHTCRCECVSETAPSAAEPPAPETAGVLPISGQENGGAAPPARPTPPRVRQARPEVVGPLDRDIIRRIVRAHINEVRHCYNQGLTADPDLSGRVTVQFTIGPAGKVLEAVAASSTLDEDDDEDGVATCITTVLKRWNFPKFEGEAAVVTYPFVLSPGS